MEPDTLTDPKVMQAAGQFLWVKIHVYKDQELAARYAVDGVPVAVMIDNQGRVLGATTDFCRRTSFSLSYQRAWPTLIPRNCCPIYSTAS